MTIVQIEDELGRRIALPNPPRRIVSLVPSLTEWMFAIDAGDSVVGVTDYCVHPAGGVARLPKLRGTKNPDRAAIVALQPDLVIANREENRERDVLALEQAGIAVYVTDPRSVSGAIHTLDQLAQIVGRPHAAEPLLADMRATHMRLVAAHPQPSTRVLVPIWRDPWMAIGGDTYADDLLRVCGAVNVAADLDGRYPRFEREQIAQLAPGLILLPSEPYRFSNADLPALRPYTACPIELIDGELLTWYGPRLSIALQTIAACISGPTS